MLCSTLKVIPLLCFTPHSSITTENPPHFPLFLLSIYDSVQIFTPFTSSAALCSLPAATFVPL